MDFSHFFALALSPATEETTSFTSLLIIVGLAFVVPLLLSRFKQLRLPIVVGEIIAGIIVGRSGFGLVDTHDPVLELLAEFGFVFLMFLSGMEIDFSSLSGGRAPANGSRKQMHPVATGSIIYVLTLALSGVMGYLFFTGGMVQNPWMMALILATNSLGIIVPVLKERRLSASRFGQTILIAAIIADFATMLLITVLVAILSSGLTLDILLIGVLFVAFFLLYRFGILVNRIKGVRRTIEELSHATAQIKVRAAFAMLLVLVGVSEVLGTEVILGAFLAGMIISLLRTPEDADLAHQLEAIGFGFFIPIFFIKVGVEFNLSALLASSQALLLVPLLVLAAGAVKILPALVMRLNFSWRESISAGVILSARLSLIIAASAIGVRLGIISEPVNAAIVLVAIISVTAAPLIFSRLAPQPDANVTRPMIVVGGDELGLRVAQQLHAHKEQAILIDSDAGHIERARKRGIQTRHAADGNYERALATVVENAHSVICILTDSQLSLRVCQLARGTYGIDHVVAQVNDPADLSRFEALGVKTINAAVDRVALLVLVARNPGLFSLLTRVDDDKEIAEVEVSSAQFVGKALRQLQLPEDVLVLALRRNGDLIVPHGNTQLNRGDRVTLLGSVSGIELARASIAAFE